MFRAALLLTFVVGPVPARAAEPGGSVDFERHVIGLLNKSGCSAGSCHGSFGGKGGLRLSLFGAEPEKDFLALTRGGGGRRINSAEPDRSLLLLKATGQVSHGGGKRFAADSWQARALRSWIAAGGRRVADSGATLRLEFTLAEHVLTKPGETVQLSVRAKFADGAEADVTSFCELRAKDDSVADVSPLGEVRAARPGDTAIIASYRGLTAVARVLVPIARTEPYPAIPEVNFVDRAVFAKLKRLNVVPSDLASDEEFLRRVMIDVTGGLPSPDEVRAFVADADPKKREKVIDKLLASPLHAALWATKMCDVTACNVEAMDGSPDQRTKRARMWHDWFRHRFATNVPYDRIVRGVLTATSREGHALRDWIDAEIERERAGEKGGAYRDRDTLDLFWRRFEGEEYFPLEKMAELTSTAFLGVRLECAQCHRHPFDRWTQTDYRAFANAFGRVRFESSPDLTAAVVDLLEERRKLPPGKLGAPIPRLREVYLSERPRRLPHPDTGAVLNARALGGPELTGADPREALADWVTHADNPFFARAFVNRVWAHYFGTGLIDPVDDLAASNPASNEPLLNALAADFVRSGFDIRKLERTILVSRAYQLSSAPNDTNLRDRGNFARSYPRSLMAEAVLDVLNDALGTKEEFGGDAPAGARAIEVATNRVRAGHAARVFQVFGRPARSSTCDCERASGPALPQTLFLMTDPVLLKKITGGRLAKLLAAKMSDARIVDELFLAALSRLPDANEKTTALERVSGAPDREAGLTDVLWALVNTREFILNH
ncbi:Uncharacterized protein OS=Singulisphaera acidiphila (strain ATCC BAA-1392 / DSM 18658 / VKM B-2454 / MOB10) GN=Sinac_5986 PE=4 SV=1: PSCyt2: PSD1 [Gemmata massiliana]|uniref:BIG2 domain-containing protein n=1 Tax=Gemmata massiliana TaxID=1210884 RepID=A0A6P2D289_9BACT|nr:DUF1549 and DUF1553 domain-containing protein [Gemmata massiliana]VTR93552.1 Uncharacterized protein OS=Singulisphaera acidiphila (strain ATCC BAA-1392 / DSM 18658 / VKM B-2454 / MOB10) GN=Sinac_5986 PE=4 SV=1: PSCyt2: PSD1 [Gemmata massiliana]